MAAILAVAASDNWNNNGSWVGGVQPTAGDDVTIVAGAVVTIPTGVTALARSVTVASTGAVAFADVTSVLSIGDATAGAGNVAFSNAGTITLTAVGTINFLSTSTTQQTITSGGQNLPNLTFNGVAGTWILSDNLNIGTGTLTVTNGAFASNGKTLTAAIFSSSNTNTRAINITNSALTLTGGSATVWNLSNSNGLTLTTTGSSITMSGTTATFSHGGSGGSGATYPTVNFTGAGNANLNAQGGGGCTFGSLTRTGTAAKIDQLIITTNCTVTGTLTLSGNTVQGANRCLIASNTRGTQRTITATGAAVVISGDVDFMDIAISGSPSWTNAGSSFVGDCGGNGSLITTNITVTATQTHTTSAGGSWSDPTKWTSRTPLPQDNVIVDNNTTGTVLLDMPRVGKDITFTGFAGTATWGSGTNCEMYGSLTLATGMTFNQSNQATFAGRGSHTITMTGKSFSNGTVNFNGPTGTYTLSDTFASTIGITHTGGTLAINGQTATMLTYALSNALGTLSGTGTINLSSTAATSVWNVSAGTITFSGTIAISTASVNNRNFIGGSKTYGTLSYTVAGSSGSLTISSGSNTFNTINFTDTSTSRSLILVISATQTVTTLNVNGQRGVTLGLISASGGTAATISMTSGVINLSYLRVQDITVTGGATFNAYHSTDISGNTGILFMNNEPGNFPQQLVVGDGMSRSEIVS